MVPGIVLEARATKVNWIVSLSLEFSECAFGWTGSPSCHPHSKTRALKERVLCSVGRRAVMWSSGIHEEVVGCGCDVAFGAKEGKNGRMTTCLFRTLLRLPQGSEEGGSSQDSCFLLDPIKKQNLRMTTFYVRFLWTKV